MLERDAAGGEIGGGLGHAQNREAEPLEPEIVGPGACFGHISLALPGQAEPEAAIVAVAFDEADDADELPGLFCEPYAPVPCFTALDLGQCDVAAVLQGAIGRVGPWNTVEEIAHDFPMREKLLHLRCIREFKRAKQQSGCAAFRNHGP